MKVSGLKFWIGRSWSKGYLTSGLESIISCADKFMFNQNSSTNQPASTNTQASTTNETINNISTPNLKTPGTAASESNSFYSNFFPADPEPAKNEHD